MKLDLFKLPSYVSVFTMTYFYLLILPLFKRQNIVTISNIVTQTSWLSAFEGPDLNYPIVKSGT